MVAFRSVLALFSVLTLRAWAQDSCKAYGVDYSNGGSYNIDAGSNDYFSFASIFQGCNQETVDPVLVSPDGNQYACSAINTTPGGQQVTSTCGIPFSAMATGDWKIVIRGNQVAVQRTIHLTVGLPQTIVVTATPTIVIGITSTPSAITVRSTITETQTLILAPGTVTKNCNGGTQTVTSYQQAPTAVVTTTLTRTQTDGQKTSFWTTTMTTMATCHYPTSSSTGPEPPYSSFTTVTSIPGIITTTYINPNPTNTPRPSFCIGSGCFRRRRDYEGSTRDGTLEEPNLSNTFIQHTEAKREAVEVVKRDVAGDAAVAAITVTVTETTYTVTQTLITTVPPSTTTERAQVIVTATVSPPPSTVCNGQGRPTATVTVVPPGQGAPITQTNIVYTTKHLSGTVWVGQTQYYTITNTASASSCWTAGGWYGL